MEIGPYSTERIIERHGPATVYGARDADGHAVLLTVIAPPPERMAQWAGRLDSVWDLEHPNILGYVDSGRTDDGQLFLAVPWLPLALTRDEAIAPAAALVLSEQVSAALDYAHQQGIVHGLLRRGHVHRLPDGQYAVRGFELGGGLSFAASLMDTAALGRLVYRALVGQDIQPGEPFSPGIPPMLADVLRRAISPYDDAEVFSSPGTFHEALANAVSQLTTDQSNRPLPVSRLLRASRTSAPTIQPVRPGPGRSRLAWFVGGIILGLIILVAGGLIVSGPLRRAVPDRISSTAVLLPSPALTVTPTLLTAGAVLPSAVVPITETPTSAFTATGTFTPTPMPTVTLTSSLTPSSTGTPTPTPSATLTRTATQTPTFTLSPTPVPDAVVSGRSGVILRSGPGSIYFQVAVIRPGNALSVLSRTENGAWLKVRYQTVEGWASAKLLRIYVNLENVPPTSAEDIAAMPTTKPCVDVVGDSIAHGGAVFEIPATGYLRAPMAPVSSLIEKEYRTRGNKDMRVNDRSVSATGISSPNHPSYFDSSEFGKLGVDRCRFTIIMPWVNDLSNGGDPAVAAPGHVAALAKMVQQLTARNSTGRILVLNYYLGAPTRFALTGFATGYTPNGVSIFNQQIGAACAPDGVLGALRQVTCVDSSGVFGAMGSSYVVGQMTRPELEADLTSAINADEMKLLNAYTSTNPYGVLIGDGVHLSLLGKTALASYLVNLMTNLPDLPPPAAS